MPKSLHNSIRRVARHAGVLLCAFLAGVFLSGCAFAVTDDGKAVLGIELGEDTGEQIGGAIAKAGSFLPSPYRELAAGVGVVVAGAFPAVAVYQRRRGERAGWEEREQDAISGKAPVGVAVVPRVNSPVSGGGDRSAEGVS